jgi:hypothetical protein
MTDWLAEALASVALRDSEQPVPIVPLVPERRPVGGFGTNGTNGTDGGGGQGTPYDGPYARALNGLLAANPTDDDKRWLNACADADTFLREWGTTAEELGWKADDLFGLHPLAPLARYDVIGLVWLLRGQKVHQLTAGEAVLENGLRHRREVKRVPPTKSAA